MIKEAIEKVLDLAQIERFEIKARNYTSKKLVRVDEPAAPVLQVNTLKGLVDYLKSGFDSREIGSFVAPANVVVDTVDSMDAVDASTVKRLSVALHIVSPQRVVAFMPVGGPWKERNTVAEAIWNRTPFPFGAWLSQEDFVIKMQAMFQPSTSWQPVMDIAGRIVCEDKAELHDDGVSQAATVSRGIRKESGVILPNPVLLRPVRTFTEVAQPESPFVFRMRSEPIALSLTEADMGAWEMVAKQSIFDYLECELPGVPIFM